MNPQYLIVFLLALAGFGVIAFAVLAPTKKDQGKQADFSH